MNCMRCKKRKPLHGEIYPQWYMMKWGEITISLGHTVLCKYCRDEIFKKITGALYEDNYAIRN